jgi:hypothetical protein
VLRVADGDGVRVGPAGILDLAGQAGSSGFRRRRVQLPLVHRSAAEPGWPFPSALE